jgi:hypothetical protein
MATFTATLEFYNEFILNLAKEINLDTDVIKVGLTTSSYFPDSENDQYLSDITNEVSGNGYAQQTASNVILSRTSNIVTLDFDDVIFSASGGNITARRFFVYDDTVTNKPLIGFGLLDNNNLDVTVTDGNTLELVINANGLLTINKV